MNFYTLPELEARGHGRRSKIYANIERGLFPPPAKFGRSSRWPEYELQALERAQLAGAIEKQIQAIVTELVEIRARGDFLAEADVVDLVRRHCTRAAA